MPYINIWEKDETGAAYDGSETVVFVPGTVDLSDDSDVRVDENGCTLIIPSNGDNALENLPGNLESDEYIKTLLKAGLQVLYWYCRETVISSHDKFGLEFLKDKNQYNIKFLTAGIPLICQTLDDSGEDDSSDTLIKTNLLDCLVEIAAARGDCAVVGALSTPVVDNISQEPTVQPTLKQLKEAFDDASTPSKANYKYAYLIAAKVDPLAVNTYPDLSYFKAYGQAIKDNTTWEALANSARGTDLSFPSSKTVSKYQLDNHVMNAAGCSFNGVITLNPQASQGGVIWGDRTLNPNDDPKRLKATAFMSIRNMISDIAKRAYYTAVRYTFDTNNDVTWTNFKGAISNLLDEMVADYKLANYRIIKKPTNNRAEIKCEIHISPYGPVEDFDIGIILHDATAEVTAE